MATLPRIGFIGLGAIGYLMARNLATHQQSHPPGSAPLLVWNRTPSKSQDLFNEVGPDKIRIAQTAEQVALECDVIITNLSNDQVVKEIYEKFGAVLKGTSPTRKIFVETSTIYPTSAVEIDQLLSPVPHCFLVTCPVFGVPAVADKRMLLLNMSGAPCCKQEVSHLLVPAVGRKAYDLGSNVANGPTFKLIGNSMIIGIMEVFTESFALSVKSGIGQQLALDLVKEVLPAPGMVAHATRVVNDEFDGSVGFGLEGILKDVTHICRLTEEHESPMPIIDIAYQHLITARAVHEVQRLEGKRVVDTLDVCGIAAGARVAAGLDPFDSKKHGNIIRAVTDD